MAPGRVERREFEYIRHGTRAFILSRDVVTGQVIAPSCGPRRTKADFVDHIRRTIATDPDAVRWHFVVDNLDIHKCEPLVRLVAELSGVEADLGVMGKSGVLRSRATPGGLPGRPGPQGGVPLHAGARLVAQPDRDLAEHPGPQGPEAGSFTSVEDLEAKVVAFIEYYNRTMARPFRWTYQGKPLWT